MHSAFLPPYFAWRSTHHHHVNDITTDFNYMPPTRAEYGDLLLRGRGRGRRIDMDFNLGNNYHHHYHHAAVFEDGVRCRLVVHRVPVARRLAVVPPDADHSRAPQLATTAEGLMGRTSLDR
ncbi:hypothetical protein DL767_007218 [Monosporascus sp. MG133]|nr:hypothetical protein DL767_007218 [Monosporascus sp. MG133]